MKKLLTIFGLVLASLTSSAQVKTNYNIIYYSTTDDKKIKINDNNAFGAEIMTA